MDTSGADEFTTYPGKCFRYLRVGRGPIQHCPNWATRTGVFRDRNGKTWTVDACAEHAAELLEPQP